MRATFDTSGIHVFNGEEEVSVFPWGTGNWRVDLRDTRLPKPTGLLDEREVPEGRPRVTSLDKKSRDQDRNILGLPKDPSADPVLLLNPGDVGIVSLLYGPLDLHSVPVTVEWARSLVVEAVNRGFEVRRTMIIARAATGRVALLTRFTTRRAVDTLELER